MSPKTRRRVFLSALVLALTLPAEMILLRALQEPSTESAIHNWAADLDQADLMAATRRIADYPYSYRKAIMRRVTPEREAEVWKEHLARYRNAHPELDQQALAVLDAAESLITPKAMARPTDADRASAEAAMEQVVAVLGRDDAEELMVWLGPKDEKLATAEPLAMKLANFVRDRFGLVAQAPPPCDCRVSYGCAAMGLTCQNPPACTVPSLSECSVWWWWECDGACVAGW